MTSPNARAIASNSRRRRYRRSREAPTRPAAHQETARRVRPRTLRSWRFPRTPRPVRDRATCRIGGGFRRRRHRGRRAYERRPRSARARRSAKRAGSCRRSVGPAVPNRPNARLGGRFRRRRRRRSAISAMSRRACSVTDHLVGDRRAVLEDVPESRKRAGRGSAPRRLGEDEMERCRERVPTVLCLLKHGRRPRTIRRCARRCCCARSLTERVKRSFSCCGARPIARPT